MDELWNILTDNNKKVQQISFDRQKGYKSTDGDMFFL